MQTNDTKYNHFIKKKQRYANQFSFQMTQYHPHKNVAENWAENEIWK